MSRVGFMVNGQQPMADRIAAAQAAESAGLHSVWAADGGGDVLLTLTAFGLNTSRIRIGSGVLVWNRLPVLAATAAAQLSQLTNDRFILGLGTGPKEWNEGWWGIPWDRPVGRMREYVRIARGAMAADPNAPFSFQGEHFQIDGFVRAFQRTGKISAPAPIWLGTTAPQMSRLAGEVADGLLLNPALPPSYVRDVVIPAVEAGLCRSGRSRRDFCLAGLVPCVVNDDLRLARRRVKSTIAGQLSRDYYQRAWQHAGFGPEVALAGDRWTAGDRDGAFDAISDDFAATIGIAGPADSCRTQLEGWLELLDIVVLLSPTFLVSDEEWNENCRRVIGLKAKG